MSRTGKWILGTVAALLGLIVLLTISLPFIIKPNDYKDLISQKIEEQTGRQVAIPGDITLKISPLNLDSVFRLGEVSVSSSPDFPGTPLLSSRLAEIQISLWPLLSKKELQLNTLRLEGVNLNLVRAEDGRSNWSATTTDQGKQPQPGKPQTEPGQTNMLGAVDIGGLDIQDLNVLYTDKRAGSSLELNNFNIDVGRIRPGNPIQVKADFALKQSRKDQQSLTARINATADLTFSPDLNRISVQKFAGNAQVGGGTLPMPELGLTLTTDLDLDLSKKQVVVSNLTMQKDDLRADGSFTLTDFSAPRASGTLRIPSFSPRAQAAAWGVTLPLADPASLNKLAADLDFNFDRNTLTISRLHLSLDETEINGTAAVNNLNAKPAYALTLKVNQLDLNRYATTPAAPSEGKEEAASAPTGPPASAAETPLLPVALLRGLNLTADLAIDTLTTGKLRLGNLQLKTDSKDGAIAITQLTTDLYDGTLSTNGQIDARQDSPTIHLVNNVKGIQLGPLFRDLSGKEEMTGRADLNLNLNSRGLTRKELTANSNGTLNLQVADGTIAKLQVIDTIRTAKALLGVAGFQQSGGASTTAASQSQPGVEGGGKPTNFATLTASGQLQNGVFRNDDLQAESELMRITGSGNVDLVREQIDYLLTIYLAKSIDRNEQTGLVDLANTPIPYRVKGTFDKIDQSAALEEIAKSQAKKVLVEELGKRLGGEKSAPGEEKGPGSAGELIQKGLKGLFGK